MPRRAGQLGVEDLEGDRAVVAEVLREVDRGHAAAAELADEAVAVGEGVAQTLDLVTQSGPPGAVRVVSGLTGK